METVYVMLPVVVSHLAVSSAVGYVAHPPDDRFVSLPYYAWVAIRRVISAEVELKFPSNF